MSKLDDIIRKVQNLIAKADHPLTPPAEADTCRNMAEALMVKYRIEEIAERPEADRIKPQWKDIWVCRAKSEFRMHYRALISYIVGHFDGQHISEYEYRDDEPWYVARVCGYDSDLRFIEVLFTQAALAFSQRLEPKYDPSLSDQVNAYLMRKAGMEGRRIAMAIYGKDDRNLRPKVRSMFKKESIARGENPDVLLGQGNSVKNYREDYANGFVSEMYFRLREMRWKQSAETGLVLAGRADAIKEEFYSRYPSLRPRPQKTSIGDGYEECVKCKKAKSGYCREHSWRRPTKSRQRATNFDALYAGASAARAVDLGTKAPKEVE